MASLLSEVNYINEIRIFSKGCLEYYVFDLSYVGTKRMRKAMSMSGEG
jgi:hypothetical protein